MSHVTLIFLISLAEVLAQDPLDSPSVGVRVQAVTSIGSRSDYDLEKLVGVFVREPRDLQWKRKDPNVKISAIEAVLKDRGTKTEEVLLKFLGSELGAARDDLFGTYGRSELFTEVISRITDGLVAREDQNLLDSYSRLLSRGTEGVGWNAMGRLRACKFYLEELAQRSGNFGEILRNRIGLLSGRFCHPTTEMQISEQCITEVALLQYLIWIGDKELPLIGQIIQSTEIKSRKAEIAWVGTQLCTKVWWDRGKKNEAEKLACLIARTLFVDLLPEHSTYVGLAADSLVQLPLEGRESQVARDLDTLRNRIKNHYWNHGLTDFLKTRQVSGTVRSALAEIGGQGLDRPQSRGSNGNGQVTSEVLPNKVQVGEEMDGQTDLEIFVDSEVKQILDAFARDAGDVKRVSKRAIRLAHLVVRTGQWDKISFILNELVKSSEPSLRYSAVLMVRLCSYEKLLDTVKLMLVDNNSWVRRCTEELFRDMGHEVWLGKVLDTGTQEAGQNGQAAARGNRPFQAELFDAVVCINAGENAERLLNGLAVGEAEPVLVESLMDLSVDREVKKVALKALGMSGTDSAVSAMLEAGSYEHNEDVYSDLIAEVQRVRNPEGLPALLRGIRPTGDDIREDLCWACAVAIARMGDPQGLVRLIAIFRDQRTDEQVREKIAKAILEVRSPQAVTMLADVVAEWDDDRLGRAALISLVMTDGCEAVEKLFLLSMKEHLWKSTERRDSIELAQAASLSRSIRDESVLSAVVKLLQHPEKEIRIAVIRGLGRTSVSGKMILKILEDTRKVEVEPEVHAAIEQTLVHLKVIDRTDFGQSKM